VTVSDEPTPGELWRRQQDHEKRSERAHEALASRLDEQIRRVEKDHDEDFAQFRHDAFDPLVERVKKVEGRSGVTWGWIVAGATLLIGVVGVLIEAWSAARGAK
jgi:hypothetical protein